MSTINDTGAKLVTVLDAKSDVQVRLRMHRDDALALLTVADLFGKRPSEAVAWALPAAMKAWESGLLALPDPRKAPKPD